MARIDEILLEGQLTLANTTLKGLILVNGAAVVALLAFFGDIISVQSGESSTKLADGLGSALWWFASGTIVSLFVSWLAYVSQSLIREGNNCIRCAGEMLRWLTVIAALVPIILLVIGTIVTVSAIQQGLSQ